MVKYACEDHIDEAMDDIIDGEETFPVIKECSDKTCSYCNKECKYEVSLT